MPEIVAVAVAVVHEGVFAGRGKLAGNRLALDRDQLRAEAILSAVAMIVPSSRPPKPKQVSTAPRNSRGSRRRISAASRSRPRSSVQDQVGDCSSRCAAESGARASRFGMTIWTIRIARGAGTARPREGDGMGILDGRVAIVTGAGQGVGLGAAVALARAGAQVVLASRTLSKVESLAEQLRKEGHEALPLACDVTRGRTSRAASHRRSRPSAGSTRSSMPPTISVSHPTWKSPRTI
jgi:short chain dehydrogenase